MKRARVLFPAACFLVLALAASPAEARRRIYVRIAPPRVRVVEVRPVAPSPRHVWIGGFNRWDGRGYVWVPGRWDPRPARPGALGAGPLETYPARLVLDRGSLEIEGQVSTYHFGS